MASGLRSHSLVEPSTSVNRNVIVPVGSPIIDFGPDSPGAPFDKQIMAYPGPHSEIKISKTTDSTGIPIPDDHIPGTLADE